MSSRRPPASIVHDGPWSASRLMRGNRPRRGRLLGIAWLLVLIGPLSAVSTLDEPAATIALVLIVLFATLYATIILTASPTSFRRDVVLWAVMTGIAMVLPAAYGESFWLPLLFAGSAGVMVLPRPFGVAALIGVNVYGIGCGLIADWSGDEFGDFVLSCALASAVVLSVSRLIRTIGELHEAQGRLARAAVNEERLRFSRDLHDLLGHSLSTIVVKSELARRLAGIDADRAAREIVDIESLARSALADVRETVSGYRELSIADEIEGARSALTASGIRCSVTPADRALPARVEAALAWGVRESVTNVIRHAQATSCAIVLGADATHATLEVIDDGRGSDPSSSDGVGLAGLAERLAAVGGTLRAGARAEGGFRVRAEVPVT